MCTMTRLILMERPRTTVHQMFPPSLTNIHCDKRCVLWLRNQALGNCTNAFIQGHAATTIFIICPDTCTPASMRSRPPAGLLYSFRTLFKRLRSANGNDNVHAMYPISPEIVQLFYNLAPAMCMQCAPFHGTTWLNIVCIWNIIPLWRHLSSVSIRDPNSGTWKIQTSWRILRCHMWFYDGSLVPSTQTVSDTSDTCVWPTYSRIPTDTIDRGINTECV